MRQRRPLGLGHPCPERLGILVATGCPDGKVARGEVEVPGVWPGCPCHGRGGAGAHEVHRCFDLERPCDLGYPFAGLGGEDDDDRVGIAGGDGADGRREIGRIDLLFRQLGIRYPPGAQDLVGSLNRRGQQAGQVGVEGVDLL